jgi:hypothetical protein
MEVRIVALTAKIAPRACTTNLNNTRAHIFGLELGSVKLGGSVLKNGNDGQRWGNECQTAEKWNNNLRGDVGDSWVCRNLEYEGWWTHKGWESVGWRVDPRWSICIDPHRAP